MKTPEFTAIKSNYVELFQSLHIIYKRLKSKTAKERVMGLLNHIGQYATNQNLLIMILTFIGLLLIEDSLENLINEWLIRSIFDKMVFGDVFDWSVITLFVFTFFSLGRYASKFYRISFNQFYLFFWMFFIYGYYRFIEERWIYKTFNWSVIDYVAYLDILLIPAVYPLFFLIFFSHKNLEISSDTQLLY